MLNAHYARDILVRADAGGADLPVTLIGMQAAFPIGRFIDAKGKEHPYLAVNKGSAAVVITTSVHDEATGAMTLGTGYVGGPGGLHELRDAADAYRGVVSLLGVSASGQPGAPPSRQTVSLYDASPFVSCELAGTRSGAHSDVYDREMGHFLGEIIRATATQP